MTYPRAMALGVSLSLAVAAVLVFLLISIRVGAQEEGVEGCPDPQQIERFTGTNSQSTSPFEITGDTFRLTLEANPIEEGEHASIFIETVDEEDGQTIPFGNLQANPVEPNTRESANVLEGPGNFSLDIEANNTHVIR